MKNKKEFWKKEIIENPNFNNLLDKLIEIKILVCNSIKLYNILGGDKDFLGEPVKEEMRNEEEKKQKKEKNKKKEKTILKRKNKKKKLLFFKFKNLYLYYYILSI